MIKEAYRLIGLHWHFLDEFGISDVDIEGFHISLHVVSQHSTVGDIQRAGGTLNERNAAVTANGEATADGYFVLMQVGYQHLFDAAILQVVLDGVERTEYNTFYAIEVLLQAKHVEQAVNVVQRLFDLFDEEDDVLSGW